MAASAAQPQVDTLMKFGFEYETMLLFPTTLKDGKPDKHNLKRLIYDVRNSIPQWDRTDFMIEQIDGLFHYVGHVSLYNYVRHKGVKNAKYMTLGVGEGSDPYTNSKDGYYTISYDGSVNMQQKRSRYTNFYTDLETFFPRHLVDVTNHPFSKALAELYLKNLDDIEEQPDPKPTELPPKIHELIFFLYDILTISVFSKVREAPESRENIMNYENMKKFWHKVHNNKEEGFIDIFQKQVTIYGETKTIFESVPEKLELEPYLLNSFMKRVMNLVEQHQNKVARTFEKVEIVSPVLTMDREFSQTIDKFFTDFEVNHELEIAGQTLLETNFDSENKTYIQPIVPTEYDTVRQREPQPKGVIIDKLYKIPTNKCFYFHNSASSCHVHVSANVNLFGQDVNIFRAQPVTLLKVIYGWFLFEPVFFSLVPYWRRENNYCNPLRTIIQDIGDISKHKDIDKKLSRLERIANSKFDNLFVIFPREVNTKDEQNSTWHFLLANSKQDYGKFYNDFILTYFQPNDGSAFEKDKSRYAALNLANAKPDGYGTVEFRIKHGSTDPIENMCFIRLYCKFVKYFVESDASIKGDLTILKDLAFINADRKLREKISGLRSLPTEMHVLNEVIPFMKGLEMLFDTIGLEEDLRHFFRRQFALVNQAQIAAMTEAATQAQELAQLVTPIFTTGALDVSAEPMDVENNPNDMAGGNALGVTMEETSVVQEESSVDSLDSVVQEEDILATNLTEEIMAGGASTTLTGTRYPIFSYGSNSAKQLAERTGAKCLEPLPAYLNNWTRVFAGYSKFREGGVASVYPLKGARVYGRVYELSKDEIDILDQYEPGYSRTIKFVNVTLPSGKTRRVRAYVYVRDDQIYTHAPSLDYMQAIRTMLDDGRVKGSAPRTKVHIRGVVLEDSGSGKKGHYAVKTFGYFFRNKIQMFKKPMTFNIKPAATPKRSKRPQSPKKNVAANTTSTTTTNNTKTQQEHTR